MNDDLLLDLTQDVYRVVTFNGVYDLLSFVPDILPW